MKSEALHMAACVRCGCSGPAENFEFSPQADGYLCLDREGCTLRKIRKALVGE